MTGYSARKMQAMTVYFRRIRNKNEDNLREKCLCITEACQISEDPEHTNIEQWKLAEDGHFNTNTVNLNQMPEEKIWSGRKKEKKKKPPFFQMKKPCAYNMHQIISRRIWNSIRLWNATII